MLLSSGKKQETSKLEAKTSSIQSSIGINADSTKVFSAPSKSTTIDNPSLFKLNLFPWFSQAEIQLELLKQALEKLLLICYPWSSMHLVKDLLKKVKDLSALSWLQPDNLLIKSTSKLKNSVNQVSSELLMSMEVKMFKNSYLTWKKEQKLLSVHLVEWLIFSQWIKEKSQI